MWGPWAVMDLAPRDNVSDLVVDIFIKKMKDYGTSWRILTATALTDQIFIKAKRISTIQDGVTRKIEEDINSEYIGIINYCVIGLIQLEKGNKDNQ